MTKPVLSTEAHGCERVKTIVTVTREFCTMQRWEIATYLYVVEYVVVRAVHFIGAGS